MQSNKSIREYYIYEFRNNRSCLCSCTGDSASYRPDRDDEGRAARSKGTDGEQALRLNEQSNRLNDQGNRIAEQSAYISELNRQLSESMARVNTSLGK